MSVHFNEHWNQFGLIAELADQLKNRSPKFGKTILQKLVYIIQEIYGVPCDYNYILYNYGPYSSELANDLSYFTLLEGVNVEWSGKGYEISPSAKTEHFKERANDFLAKNKDVILKTIENFGSMSAKELELRSTIIFVDKQITNLDEEQKKDMIVNKVSEIKPHFTVEEIKNAYDELLDQQFLA